MTTGALNTHLPALAPLAPGGFLHQQITEVLREAILSGRLEAFKAGSRLPSMEELARHWGTSYFTIRQAMKPLVQEGLVEHRRRVGSIVKGARPTLARVGIYYGADVLGMAETTFYRSLHAELRQRLAAREVELVPFIDERPEAEQSTPLPALMEAVEARTVQALLSPLITRHEARWYPELPLPKALFGSLEMPWAVTTDQRQQLLLALKAVKEQGARSVGVIANLPRDLDQHAELPLFGHFRELAATLGLETRPEWQCLPPRILLPSEMERFGYHAFRALWSTTASSLSAPPEALLSASDIIGRGVLMAVLQQGIAVPESLRVVQWVNAGTPLFTPLPIDRLVLKEADVADALLRQLDLQMSGTPAIALAPIAVPASLESFSPSFLHPIL